MMKSFEEHTYSDNFGEWLVLDIIKYIEEHDFPIYTFDVDILADTAFEKSPDEEGDEVPGSEEFIERAEKSDLSFPIITVIYDDGIFIADGNHRLWKAKHIEGDEFIDGYLITADELHDNVPLADGITKTSELDRWFKEKWVDISKKKDGKHPPCGRSDADKGKYPKCRPSKRITKETPKTSKELSSSQKASAVKAKRRTEKKKSKPAGGGARKPKIAPALKRKSFEINEERFKKIANYLMVSKIKK